MNEDGTAVSSVITEGLNPYFVTPDRIASIISAKVLPAIHGVEKVFFYGAGCGLQVKARLVGDVLDTIIETRFRSEVSGDILGAARSLLQNESGIACILGTGANSCLYDGRSIVSIMPSLGFMFSDWGSGTVMCRDMISLVLQELMPKPVMEDFYTTYKIERAEILDNIYNRPMPNRFLASFTPFLLRYADLPECKKIIEDNFRQFFSYYVVRYPLASKVSFTGSIAYRFRVFLSQIASEFNIEIQTIVQHPMDGLVKYHCVTVPVIG